MPIVHVPGVGNFQFPDGMTQAEMAAALDHHVAQRTGPGPSLEAPPIDPVDVVEQAAFPGAMLTKPMTLLAGKLASRLAGAAGTVGAEGTNSYLEEKNPNHPILNTLLGLGAGVMSGRAAEGLVGRLKRPAPLPFAKSSEQPTSEQPVTDIPPSDSVSTPPLLALESRIVPGSREYWNKMREILNRYDKAKGTDKTRVLRELHAWQDYGNLKVDGFATSSRPQPSGAIPVPPGGFRAPVITSPSDMIRMWGEGRNQPATVQEAAQQLQEMLSPAPSQGMAPTVPFKPVQIPEDESVPPPPPPPAPPPPPPPVAPEEPPVAPTPEPPTTTAPPEPPPPAPPAPKAPKKPAPVPVAPEDSSALRDKARKMKLKASTTGDHALAEEARRMQAKADLLDQEKKTDPSSVTFQSSFIPGGKEFYEQDIAPSVAHVRRAWDSVKRILSPQSRGKLAAYTASKVRASAGEAARQMELSYAPVENVRKRFFLNPSESLPFIHAIETGAPIKDPELNAAAKSIRETFDDLWNTMHDMGLIKSYIENYFPHLWKDDEALNDTLSRYTGKRPWEGTKTHLKQRFYQTIAGGIENGKVLASENPIELFLASASDMNRLIHARKAWEELKDEGLAKFVRFGQEPPIGWNTINDRIAKVLRVVESGRIAQRGPDKGKLVTRNEGLAQTGSYYLPDEVAQVLDNHLSKGLVGNPIYDTVRTVANGMNSFQLGLSAFHFSFVSLDSATSTVALGLKEASDGNVASGAKKVLSGMTVLPAVAKTFNEGSKLMRAYLSRSDMDPEMKAMVQAVVDAGGRVHIDPIYRAPQWQQVVSRIRSGNIVGGALGVPFAVIGSLSKPLFEVYVPRMKLGVFSQMARSAMESHPDASPQELRELVQKAWDSVDNRLGMMVYDNLFWNKTMKDMAMVSTRSVGWNLGTIRELGGGVKDLESLVKNKEMSHRLSYVIALPVMTMWMGGLYYYAVHGEAPKHILDYFYPPTGQKRADGTEIRIALPTYMKDVFAYGNDPMQTIVNKANPLWSTLIEMYQNKNFYGEQIANPQDPILNRAAEQIGYVFGQITPFSVRNFEQRKNAGQPLSSSLESFFGFNVAPHEIGETKSERELGAMLSARSPVGGFSTGSNKKRDERNKILSLIRNKQVSLPEIRKSVSSGVLSLRDVRDIIKTAHETRIQSGLSHLGLRDSISVYRDGTPEEKRQLLPVLAKKLRTLNTMSRQEREALIPELRQIFTDARKSKSEGR